MLMNSQYDGYVFGQATSPLKRKQLVILAKRGHPAAKRIVRAQNQLHGFGDDDEQGSGIKTGDGSDGTDSGIDPNGWPPSSDVESPPPAPPPQGSGGTTLNDLRGMGSSVVTGLHEAASVYNDVKNTVAPVATQVSSPGAQAAATVAGNAGSQNPARIASAVQAFRVAVAAFISSPSAANFNNAIASWQTALNAYSDDAGSPPANTATMIARIISALNVAASKYQSMYDYWDARNKDKSGDMPVFVASATGAAHMATLTAREGAPTAAQANDLYARAGIPGATPNSNATDPSGSSGGLSTGLLIGGGVLAFLLLR